MHHWVGLWKFREDTNCLLITNTHFTWPTSTDKGIREFSRTSLRAMNRNSNSYEKKPLVYSQLVEWDYESTSNGEPS